MDQSKIGVFVESFGLGLHGGIAKAAEIGAGALQLTTVTRELSPDTCDRASRKALAGYIRRFGLSIASTCGDLGGHGLAVAAENEGKLPKYLAQVDLAVDLGCDVITTHIGVIPQDETDERYGVLLDAMGQLGHYAQRAGVRWAIETGPETAEVLLGFVDKLPKSVGVNLDPANFVMVTGTDPIAATRLLGERIYHCHVKDGKMLKYAGPDVIYEFFAQGGIGDLRLEEYFLETPLGKGNVGIRDWLSAMKETGYGGYYTVERETGKDPARDIRMAVDFLRGV